MAEKITNIAKNTSYFTIGLILQKIISFAYFTIIARALGPEDLGKYYFAISFTTIFAIFIDLGMANVLTREVAKDEKDASKLLSNILAIKIPLAILSFLIVAGLVNILGYPELTRELVYLSSISMILDSFTLIFFATIRGFHNLFYESISSFLFQVIVFISGLTILRMGFGLGWLIGSLAFASAANFLYSLLLTTAKFKIKIFPSFNKELTVKIIQLTIPFAVYAIFNRVYNFLDSVLLSYFAGDKYVGIYQIAFKIIMAIQFLPMAFTATLYPAMSSYWSTNKKQLVVTFERAMNYLIIISVPITIGIIALADKIVLIFKSGYSEAVLPLQIVMASNVFNFLAFPIGSLLSACDRQKRNTFIMGTIMSASIILNLILIPRFNAVGASITMLITTILQFSLGIYSVPQIIEVRFRKILSVFYKVFFAGALMGIIAFYLKSSYNIILVIPVSGVIYFILLYLLKAFTKEDVISIWLSFRRKSEYDTNNTN